MGEDRDAAAIERMARALGRAYDEATVERDEDGLEATMGAIASLTALCAGPLPRALLRRAIEELREPSTAMRRAGGHALLPPSIDFADEVWRAILDAKLAELDAEEKSGG